jgi:ribosomal protein S18 acetylase RimI-like enzyme
MIEGQPMELVVRRATESDLSGVTSVFAEENCFHAQLLPERFQVVQPIVSQEWYDRVMSDPNRCLFVAELGDEIAGVMLLRLASSPDDPICKPRSYVYVEEIAVAKARQGQGIGRRLMRQAEQWANDQGARELELDVWEANRGAIAFYEALGHEAVRRRMVRRL